MGTIWHQEDSDGGRENEATAEEKPESGSGAGRMRNGIDGTRTRDLRSDRSPSRALIRFVERFADVREAAPMCLEAAALWPKLRPKRRAARWTRCKEASRGSVSETGPSADRRKLRCTPTESTKTAKAHCRSAPTKAGPSTKRGGETSTAPNIAVVSAGPGWSRTRTGNGCPGEGARGTAASTSAVPIR